MASDLETNDVLLSLARWGSEHGWVGPDPYEGLNTALGRLARGRRPRQAVVQLYKASPRPLPWPLRAAPRPNSKALALALSGYCTGAGAGLPEASLWRQRLPAMLERLNLGGDDAAAWSYHFDVQTRHLFYSSETANAIATCFVANALLDLHAAGGGEPAAELALRSRPFLLSLQRRDPAGRAFFAYIGAGSELIHNASVMVAGTLARMHGLQPDPAAEVAIGEAVATAVELQPADGVWPYGERSDLGWADNFHHAYILDGLAQTQAELGLGEEALARGLAAWRQQFFGPGDEARLYPSRPYPLEAHSYASAIDCLCTLGALGVEPDAFEFADRLARAAIRDLWLPDEGRFAFKRSARGLNRREFMRWTNAPMFRALARLQSVSARTPARRRAGVGSSGA